MTEKPIKIRHVQRPGSDPVFLRFEPRSKPRDEVVHLVPETNNPDARFALCGLHMVDGWHRYADCYPQRLFVLCGRCSPKANPLVKVS